MKALVLLMGLVAISFGTTFGQNKKTDSVYFLNIERIFKLKVLQVYNPTATIPQISIAFPYSAYDSVTKIVRILDLYPDCFRTTDTTTVLIRISKWIDQSLGSGSTDDLIQFTKSPLMLDSCIRLDSISSNGIYYLMVNNNKIQLEANKCYMFTKHQEVKKKAFLLDYITEYGLINYGHIRRKVECEVSKY